MPGPSLTLLAPTLQTLEPIVPPVDRALLRADIAGLSRQARLVEQSGLEVYIAEAEDMPWVLREIGRLREVSFRAVGEGSGQSSDLDAYDAYYDHLFVWHRHDEEIVGAYRIGRIDRLVAERGVEGLYTASLWDFDAELFDRLGPTLELGRSFVQPRYQRQPTSLFLLWKGIGHFVAAHPEYRRLFGPVSISNDYHLRSRTLIAQWLRAHRQTQLAHLAQPRHPFLAPVGTGGWAMPDSVAALESQVDEIEGRRRSLPVLLKEYLRLGGELVELNVDPLFGNVLDALIVVDLDRTARRRLGRYMGEQLDAFLAAAAAVGS